MYIREQSDDGFDLELPVSTPMFSLPLVANFHAVASICAYVLGVLYLLNQAFVDVPVMKTITSWIAQIF